MGGCNHSSSSGMLLCTSVLFFCVCFLMTRSSVSASTERVVVDILPSSTSNSSSFRFMSAALSLTCSNNLQALASACNSTQAQCCSEVSYVATTAPQCYCDFVDEFRATGGDAEGLATALLNLFTACQEAVPPTVQACLSGTPSTPPPPSSADSPPPPPVTDSPPPPPLVTSSPPPPLVPSSPPPPRVVYSPPPPLVTSSPPPPVVTYSPPPPPLPTQTPNPPPFASGVRAPPPPLTTTSTLTPPSSPPPPPTPSLFGSNCPPMTSLSWSTLILISFCIILFGNR